MGKRLFTSLIIFISICLLICMPAYAFPPSDSVLLDGIDVSEWQGTIDFAEVAADGIRVVYIRASEGTDYVDPYFRENYTNAKANGLQTGFYHYLTATNEEEARAEADFFVSNISGTSPDCRLAMDFEEFGSLGIEEINNISQVFLETVESLSGKEVVIYSDAYNAREVFSEELAQRYPIWVADYYVSEPGNNGKWDTWVGFQYTDRGEINGIDGYVDRDYYTNGIFLSDTTQIEHEGSPNTGTRFTDIIVQRGDTLSQIALEYNTSYQYLAQINNIPNPNLIYVGQVLEVPVLTDNNIHDTSHILYIVQWGNTLTGISRRYGVSIESIVELNNIANPNLIYAGQILRIPNINN